MILFWWVVFLFAFIPLYPKFPLLNVPGTFVAVRLEDILIAIAYIGWAASLILSKQTANFFKDKINLGLLLFFFIGLVSLFSANFLTHTVSFNLSLLHWARRVEFMMLLPLVATVIKTKRQLKTVLLILSLVVILVNVYALGQQYLNWPVISTTNSEFSKGLVLSLSPGARVNSTFAGHYDLAVFLAMVLVLVSSLFFALNRKFKVFALGLGLLSFWVLIMTAARLSFVASLAGIFCSLVLLKKFKFIMLLVLIMLGVLIYPSQLRDRLISTVTVNIFGQGERYQGQTEDQRLRSKLNIPTLAIKTSSESAITSTFATPPYGGASDITPGEPIDTTQLGVYRSFSIRLNLEWPAAIRAFLKNPFLGTGYSSLGIATDNDFLRSLGEVGILGTGAFALFLIEIGRRLVKNFRENDKFIKYFSAGTLSLILAFLINALFIDVFEASKVASLLWMIVGANLAVRNFK